MNKKFQASSVGGKVRAVKYHAPVLAVKVRALVLEWFVKARTAMKGRIPSKLFKLKAIEFYDDEWFQNRKKEYEVLSRKSGKRTQFQLMILLSESLITFKAFGLRYFSFHLECDPSSYNSGWLNAC